MVTGGAGALGGKGPCEELACGCKTPLPQIHLAKSLHNIQTTEPALNWSELKLPLARVLIAAASGCAAPIGYAPEAPVRCCPMVPARGVANCQREKFRFENTVEADTHAHEESRLRTSSLLPSVAVAEQRGCGSGLARPAMQPAERWSVRVVETSRSRGPCRLE